MAALASNPTVAARCFMDDGHAIAREVERCPCGAVLGFCAECASDFEIVTDSEAFRDYREHWRAFHAKHQR